MIDPHSKSGDSPAVSPKGGMTMQLRELEWFTTLAETQHMTEASTRLNISQPTLSRALGRLERKLGVQLFDRHQNRLRLNRYGEIFQSHALRAISELDRGEEHIATLVDPDRGSVSLGFMNSLGGWFIPDLLNRYRRHAPSTSFELRGGASAAMVDDVEEEPSTSASWRSNRLQTISTGFRSDARSCASWYPRATRSKTETRCRSRTSRTSRCWVSPPATGCGRSPTPVPRSGGQPPDRDRGH